MINDSCILTTKDFTILEIMRDRGTGHDNPLAAVLKRKLETANVVFRDDIPDNVATLSSRVTFRIDDRDADTRVIVAEPTASPVGMHLPITTRRGMALLGLAEGQAFCLNIHEGFNERIVLEKVHYQPEAATKMKSEPPGPTQRRSALKLVYGGCR